MAGSPEITRGIPHRPPFLFVDAVVESSPDRIVTQYRADPTAGFFQGHYPGNPVMPGVLICECAFQAGALLLARRMASPALPGSADVVAGTLGTPVLTRINEAKFRHMVRPGEVLNVEVQLDEELGGAYFMTGRVSAGGNNVLRVTFACTLVGTES